MPVGIRSPGGVRRRPTGRDSEPGWRATTTQGSGAASRPTVDVVPDPGPGPATVRNTFALTRDPEPDPGATVARGPGPGARLRCDDVTWLGTRSPTQVQRVCGSSAAPPSPARRPSPTSHHPTLRPSPSHPRSYPHSYRAGTRTAIRAASRTAIRAATAQIAAHGAASRAAGSSGVSGYEQNAVTAAHHRILLLNWSPRRLPHASRALPSGAARYSAVPLLSTIHSLKSGTVMDTLSPLRSRYPSLTS